MKVIPVLDSDEKIKLSQLSLGTIFILNAVPYIKGAASNQVVFGTNLITGEIKQIDLATPVALRPNAVLFLDGPPKAEFSKRVCPECQEPCDVLCSECGGCSDCCCEIDCCGE